MNQHGSNTLQKINRKQRCVFMSSLQAVGTFLVKLSALLVLSLGLPISVAVSGECLGTNQCRALYPGATDCRNSTKETSICMCGAVACNTTTSNRGIKWHPGHYIMVNPKSPKSAADVVINNPEITGIQLNYKWRDFEKGKGVYDFTHLEEYVEYMKRHGKRTMVLIALQNYNSGGKCVPDYVINGEEYKGGQWIYSGDKKRCTPKFWVPAVTDRIIALNKALGDKFNKEPYFEAYQRAEIAVHKPHGDNTGFSADAVNKQALREFEALSQAFPHTLVFVGANWATRTDDFFAKASTLPNAGIWGPDVIIRREDQDAMTGTWAYAYYPSYSGRIPLAISDQIPNRRLAGKFTMDEIWDFVITDPNNLYVNHAIWTSYQQFFKEIELPYIKAKGGYIENTSCPENIVRYGGGCWR